MSAADILWAIRSKRSRDRNIKRRLRREEEQRRRDEHERQRQYLLAEIERYQRLRDSAYYPWIDLH